MQQPDPEAIENKQRGIKVNEEMRAAVEDILRGNTGIVLDLKAELYRRRKNHRWANPTSMCHGLFFTPKARSGPFDRNREDTKDERHRYAIHLKKLHEFFSV